MTVPMNVRTLAEADVAGLTIHRAGAVDIRRDIYQVITFIRANGLTRSYRENNIPKTSARKLAKLVSYASEADHVETEGLGYWSDTVLDIARSLGLCTYDVEGSYAGYTSSEPSFPDNVVEVDEDAWQAWMSSPAHVTERRILSALTETWPSELFHYATLLATEPFSAFGSATGPASRMKLPAIRSKLLELLSELPPDRWVETSSFVEQLRRAAPTLILDPATRQPTYESRTALDRWEWNWGKRATHRKKGETPPPKPAIELEDIYCNFKEVSASEGRWSSKGTQITSKDPNAFARVEGRYIEWFLCEIPYLSNFVDLAYRPDSDPHGTDLLPRFERLRAFRVTPRLRQVLAGDPSLDRIQVTALPNFEIVIDAASYPCRAVSALAPITKLLVEDGPVIRMRIDRKTVIKRAAESPDAPSAGQILKDLCGGRLPGNVATEIDAWEGHAEKLTLYEAHGLVELTGDETLRKRAAAALGSLVEEQCGSGFLVVGDADKAFRSLYGGDLVPRRVDHPSHALLGAAAPPTKRARTKKVAKPRIAGELRSEDLVGYRSTEPALLAALRDELSAADVGYLLADGGFLLLFPSASLPKVRAAIRRLSERFDVTLV